MTTKQFLGHGTYHNTTTTIAFLGRNVGNKGSFLNNPVYFQRILLQDGFISDILATVSINALTKTMWLEIFIEGIEHGEQMAITTTQTGNFQEILTGATFSQYDEYYGRWNHQSESSSKQIQFYATNNIEYNEGL